MPIRDITVKSPNKSDSNNLMSPERRKKKNKLVFKNNIIKNLGLKNINAISMKINNQENN